MSVIKLCAALASQEVFPQLPAISAALARKDPTIWGPQYSEEISRRLDWIDLSHSSRELLPLLDSLWVWARERKFQRVILAGMGGSSLAAQVIAHSCNKELLVLDSTDPHSVRGLLDQDLSESLLIVSSKSGTTIETLTHWAIFEAEMKRVGIDPTEQIIIITDPDSPLDIQGRKLGYRVFHGNPKVGGRYSALSIFGLLPAALLGIDVSLLLDDADEALIEILQESSPASKVASYLAKERFFIIKDHASTLGGFGLWVEQLIAESTGKNGKGILPLVRSENAFGLPAIDLASDLIAPLGAQFILWQWVSALLGALLEVNPFDQPDVESSKKETVALLEVATRDQKMISGEALMQELEQVFTVRDISYISLQIYLDQRSDKKIEELQLLLEKRYQIPVSISWGPALLHSTGQFHKGGPQVGVFIQITGDSEVDLPIPGRNLSLQQLILAQADGDAKSLEAKKNPVYRVHLSKRKSGIETLLEIFKS
jgi:glucose-6-phosphate isomerase